MEALQKMGLFIVIDGIDGAGKSTQAHRFCDLFRECGFSAIRSFEPTDGPWGRKIRESAVSGRMSLEDELNAFLADRREHIESLIQPALLKGNVVIVDRYFYSTVAYQGLRGLNTDELLARMRAEFLIPNVTLFFDLPVPVAMQRISEHRGDTPNEFEQQEALTRIRDAFSQMAEVCGEVSLIDCSGDAITVSSQVASVLSHYLLSHPDCLSTNDQAKSKLLTSLHDLTHGMS